MSAFSPVRRAEVAMRAGERCEYCHLPTRGQVATFPIDHIVPRSRGGTNDLPNLALTCPHCNAQKWTTDSAVDPATATTERLFHPRQDVWDDHFAWGEGCELTGTSAVGRATIAELQINSPSMVELRRLLAQVGLFPELVGG